MQCSHLLKSRQPGNGPVAQWYLRGCLTIGPGYSQLGNSSDCFPYDRNSCVWRNCFWIRLIRMRCLEQWQPSSNNEKLSLGMARWKEETDGSLMTAVASCASRGSTWPAVLLHVSPCSCSLICF